MKNQNPVWSFDGLELQLEQNNFSEKKANIKFRHQLHLGLPSFNPHGVKRRETRSIRPHVFVPCRDMQPPYPSNTIPASSKGPRAGHRGLSPSARANPTPLASVSYPQDTPRASGTIAGDGYLPRNESDHIYGYSTAVSAFAKAKASELSKGIRFQQLEINLLGQRTTVP